MFSLFFGLWKYFFSKVEYYVLILGIDAAGKTTFLEKIKTLYTERAGLPPQRIVPTVGLNIGRIVVGSVKLLFWDLGGQSALRTIWDKYYSEAHALVFVVDAANETRLQEAKAAFEEVVNERHLAGVPVLLLANKKDLKNCVSKIELEERFHINSLHAHRCHVQPISAITGEGIREGIDWLVESLKTVHPV